MRGWMFRFKGGPFHGETVGPSPVAEDLHPPERVAVRVVNEGKGIAIADATKMLPESLHHFPIYRRVNMSDMEEPSEESLIVRGADYELEDPQPIRPSPMRDEVGRRTST